MSVLGIIDRLIFSFFSYNSFQRKISASDFSLVVKLFNRLRIFVKILLTLNIKMVSPLAPANFVQLYRSPALFQ
ncbi:hypothetical protein ANTRET_LOCUS7082 [Anthophora retusa]